MSKFKCVLFDMDGVLIDSEPYNIGEVKTFFERYGGVCTTEFLHSLVGCSFYNTYLKSKELLKNDWTQEDFREKWDAFTKERPTDYTKLFNEGVIEIMEQITNAGLKVGICSASDKNEIVKMATTCGCMPFVSHIISGEECHRSKPNPEIYLKMAEYFGFESSQCLVIEDSTFGIEAGKKAGMVVLALKDRNFGINQSESDHIIDTLLDIENYL